MTYILKAIPILAFLTQSAFAEEAKYDWKPATTCPIGITSNKDGSTTYAFPYPVFTAGKNDKGEATVAIALAGLILFKQQSAKPADHNCKK